MQKVKSYSNDQFNDHVNMLAKQGMNTDKILVDYKFLHSLFSLQWNNLTIENAIHPMLKMIYQVKHFYNFITLHRNEDLFKTLSSSQVDWVRTWKQLDLFPDIYFTTFEKCYFKTFKVKCLLLDLPVLSILKV